MTTRTRWIVAVAILLPAIAITAIVASRMPREMPAPAPGEGVLPDFTAAATWLNGGPVTPDSLRGHPVVVALWSDTDPRSFEVLPRVEAWYRAYTRLGARVVGVDVPVFRFATDPAVARRAAERLTLGFPIALDPAYALQRELAGEEGLPQVVVSDPAGRIVARFGAGRMDEADRAIRDQMRRLHPAAFPAEPDPIAPAPAATPAPRFVYLGVSRVTEGPLANAVPGRAQTFTTQFRFQEEGKAYVPYPVGRWTPDAEGLVAVRGGAATYVAVRYEGGQAFAVLEPPAGGVVRVWILGGNDWLPSDALGSDVRLDASGASYVDVTEPRLYSIARGEGRVLRCSPESPGLIVHAFVFTR